MKTDCRQSGSEWLQQFSAKREGKLQTWGICEWYNEWAEPDTPDAPLGIERLYETLDAHLQHDVDHVVWDAGRTVLTYHSDLPNVTLLGDRLSDPPTEEERAWMGIVRLFKKHCFFECYKEWCREHRRTVVMRLCMNRHYRRESQSHFAAEHPEFYERGCDGQEDQTRLCYAIPEVRQERIDILLELHRKGAEVLVLDFCRQPPILRYHPTLLAAYQDHTGTDPREIASYDVRDYLDWFRFRAGFLTEFMRELRAGLREQERELERPCCLIARIPDSSPMLIIGAGTDVETWLREDLVDATMLSPLVWSEINPGSHPGYHAELCHRYGKACVGGIGSLALFPRMGLDTGPQMAPWKQLGFYIKAFQQHQAGVDGMSIYQTDGIYIHEEIAEMVRPFNDAAACERKYVEIVEQAPKGHHAAKYGFSPGLDWHSTTWGGFSLGPAKASRL